MQPDDEICVCFHVSLRKLLNFARRERPKHAAQMSNCLEAGTGCGWCIPILCRIHAAADAGRAFAFESTPEEYQQQRTAYRKAALGKHSFETGKAEGESPPDP